MYDLSAWTYVFDLIPFLKTAVLVPKIEFILLWSWDNEIHRKYVPRCLIYSIFILS